MLQEWRRIVKDLKINLSKKDLKVFLEWAEDVEDILMAWRIKQSKGYMTFNDLFGEDMKDPKFRKQFEKKKKKLENGIRKKSSNTP